MRSENEKKNKCSVFFWWSFAWISVRLNVSIWTAHSHTCWIFISISHVFALPKWKPANESYSSQAIETTEMEYNFGDAVLFLRFQFYSKKKNSRTKHKLKLMKEKTKIVEKKEKKYKMVLRVQKYCIKAHWVGFNSIGLGHVFNQKKIYI